MIPEQVAVGIKVKCNYPDPSCCGWIGTIVLTRHHTNHLIDFYVEWDNSQANEDYPRSYNRHWNACGSEYFEVLK